MSASVPATPSASTSSTGYSLARPEGKCFVCGQPITPGQKMMAAMRHAPVGFERLDISLECWPAFDHANVLASWQTVMPVAETRQKVFVDDEILKELFIRLADVSEPVKVNFRFMLGLVLMRKRSIVYESSRVEEGREIWTVRLRASEDRLDLINPRLSEDQIAEVAAQMGEILNQEIQA